MGKSKIALGLILASMASLISVNATELTNPTDKETPVKYNGIGNQVYELTVPSLLHPGDTGEVRLYGTWDSTKKLNIETAKQVTLTNNIDNGEKVLDIEFDNISKEGNNTIPIDITKQISIEQIENALFGTWNGIITYKANFKNIESIKVEQDRYQLLGTDTMEIPIQTMYGNEITIENSDPSIATAIIQNNKIIVTPIKEGVTTLKLKTQVTNYSEPAVKEIKIDISHNYVNGVCSRCGEKDITQLPAGLYNTNWVMTKSWQQLLDSKVIYVNDGVLTSNVVKYTDGRGPTNNSSSALNGILIIPEGIITLNDSFCSCDYLQGVVIPESVTNMTNQVFYSISSKLHNIMIKSGNKHFKTVNGIMYNIDMTTLIKYPANKTATTFVIPNSVKVLGGSAFMSNRYIQGVTMPNGLERIETTAFSTCNSLRSLDIPDSVTYIGGWAFNENPSLTSVKLPDNLEFLGNGFISNTGVTKIFVPKSVITMPKGLTGGKNYETFYNVKSNFKIYCEAPSKPEGWSDYWNCYNAWTSTSSAYRISTTWGVTREQFNALP